MRRPIVAVVGRPMLAKALFSTRFVGKESVLSMTRLVLHEIDFMPMQIGVGMIFCLLIQVDLIQKVKMCFKQT